MGMGQAMWNMQLKGLHMCSQDQYNVLVQDKKCTGIVTAYLEHSSKWPLLTS